MKQTEERHSESRMREIRQSGSMRGSSGAAPPPVAPYSTDDHGGIGTEGAGDLDCLHARDTQLAHRLFDRQVHVEQP
jgi:hypothetical protein